MERMHNENLGDKKRSEAERALKLRGEFPAALAEALAAAANPALDESRAETGCAEKPRLWSKVTYASVEPAPPPSPRCTYQDLGPCGTARPPDCGCWKCYVTYPTGPNPDQLTTEWYRHDFGACPEDPRRPPPPDGDGNGSCIAWNPPPDFAPYPREPPAYYHVDPLGSTRLVTDKDGVVTKRIDYMPFGEEIPTTWNLRSSIAAYIANPTGDPRQIFTGKERDRESSLDYFGARYYSASQGRFTSPDDVFNDTHVDDPASWNLYAYVRNNPLTLVDPDGRSAWKKIWTVARVVHGKINERHTVKAMTNRKAAERTAEILAEMPVGGRRSQRVVQVGSAEERMSLAKRLSPDGKVRPNRKTGALVESSGGFPEHSHAKGGAYEDVHIQTAAAGSAATAGVLTAVATVVAPYTAAAAENPDATADQIVAAALWDIAATIDPVALTDAAEMALGLDPSMVGPPAQPAPTPEAELKAGGCPAENRSCP